MITNGHDTSGLSVKSPPILFVVKENAKRPGTGVLSLVPTPSPCFKAMASQQNAVFLDKRGSVRGRKIEEGGSRHPVELTMKRRPTVGSDGQDHPIDAGGERNKKPRPGGGAEEEEAVVHPPAPAEEEEELLGEDLVFEVLKRAEARTLASAACCSRRWRRLAEDERLWEAVCTRHWANIGCGNQQLRSVVLALGGFRRLHSLYLLPLLAPSLRRQPAASAPFPPLPLPAPAARRPNFPARWGKDEVQLSLSLLSIGFFEKMNPNNKRNDGGGGGTGYSG